jgi:SSS family solute:Na+ symporter
MDFYRKLHPRASQAQLVWIGRVATTVMVLIALVWIPVIQGAKSLYDYLQGVQGYLGPPIFTVFFLGVFIKRVNAPGCLWALVVGFVLAMFRLAVDTPVSLGLAGFQDGYPAGSFLWIVNNIYFQYYSVLIFLICAATMLVVSYATPPPPDGRITGLTYATVTPEQKRETRRSWNRWDVVNSGVVLALILAAYVYFRG